MTPEELAESARRAIRARIAKHERDHTYRALILSEADKNDVAEALDDVCDNGVTYLVSPDDESNVVCAIVPWERYLELVNTEVGSLERSHALGD